MARKKKVEEEQPVTAEVVETKKKSSKKAPKTKMSAFFQHISSCLTIRFDNISMTSLVFSNRLLPVLWFNF